MCYVHTSENVCEETPKCDTLFIGIYMYMPMKGITSKFHKKRPVHISTVHFYLFFSLSFFHSFSSHLFASLLFSSPLFSSHLISRYLNKNLCIIFFTLHLPPSASSSLVWILYSVFCILDGLWRMSRG